MRSKLLMSMFVLAAALGTGCLRSEPAPDTQAVSSSTPAVLSAGQAPPSAPEVATPPAPLGDGTALYELDTQAQPAPAAGSALDRILKGLHMRVCVRGDVAPLGSFESGGLDGLEIELATEIVRQISVDYKQPLKVDWTVVAAPDRLKRLQDDGCDLLVASLSQTPERAAQVSLSKVYLRTDKVLLAATKVTRKTPVIAKVGGTTGDAGIKGTERAFTSYQEIVYAMDSDEIDYLVTDRPIAAHLIRSSSKPFTISKTLAPGAESYVAATQNGHPELIAAVNKALDDLARSGRLALIHRRWL